MLAGISSALQRETGKGADAGVDDCADYFLLGVCVFVYSLSQESLPVLLQLVQGVDEMVCEYFQLRSFVEFDVLFEEFCKFKIFK